MMRIIARGLARAAEALAVVWALATFVFLVLRILPGDPAALVLGDEATPGELAALRHKLHLDEPLLAQYTRFLSGLVRLDLGSSIRRPGVLVRDAIGAALGPTTELATLGVVLGAAMGVSASVLCAGPWLGPRGRVVFDRALIAVGSVPLVAVAPLVTFWLAAEWQLVPLPADPNAGFRGLLFAATLLAIPLGAHVARIGRATLLGIERAQFVQVARAKGARELRVWFLHALPASLGPLLVVIATQWGALLGGAAVLEKLFERPGLGTLLVEAFVTRDLPVLEAAVVAGGVLFVAVQTGAALVQTAMDPRTRTS